MNILESRINKQGYTPKDQEYYYPMYVDCCGLVRRAGMDLEKELGFEIGWWNQGYQFDTLPIKLKEEDLKPGDIIFYSAKLYDKNGKVYAHEMVHIEVFVGTNGSKESIGARRKGGVVQKYDNFRFESKRFYKTIYYLRSLDTWLDGIGKSWCSEHEWKSTKKLGSYYANLHRMKRKEKEREKFHQIDIYEYAQNIAKKYVQKESSNDIVDLKKLDEDYEFVYKTRLSIVAFLNELDFARFKIGFHMVNRIPTLYNLTKPKNVIKLGQALKVSMKLGYLDTFINLDEMILESYILDSIPDLWQFLNCENAGTWELVSNNYINPLNITVVTDILKFKSKILGLRDLAPDELDSGSESEEDQDEGMKIYINNSLEPSQEEEESKQLSPTKKAKSVLDPIPNPELNPNLPNLLQK